MNPSHSRAPAPMPAGGQVHSFRHIEFRRRCLLRALSHLKNVAVLALTLAGLMGQIEAQDRLKSMPGYDRYKAMEKEIPDSWKSGALNVTWADDSQSFEYRRDGKRYRFELATMQATEVTNTAGASSAKKPAKSSAPAHSAGDNPDRGRQYTTALSPDGKQKAFYRERNVWLVPVEGTNEVALTTEGNATNRVKLGSASWVYGEELDQKTAMWWSPDSRKLAFYRFDERQVADFPLQLDQTKAMSRLDLEPYPKPGMPNPVVDLLIRDLESGRTVTVDVRDGQPFSDASVGHYVYGLQWTRDGRELLFHRTNRRQNVLELVAADPETGHCRVVIREEWPASWVENQPTLRFLEDGQRFLWSSERTGWRNLYLYDVRQAGCVALTPHRFEVDSIVRVDEAQGWLDYLARDGDNPLKPQLHRVRLDGTDQRRLTDPALHHRVTMAPDGRYFVDVSQTHDEPPTTVLRDAEGRFVAELARSDLKRYRELGLRPVELIRFASADGSAELYGLLHFPSRFDPRGKYPLLVSVYAGPSTEGAHETFTLPSTLTELGFLVASFDSRSAAGRGKRQLDSIYRRLGITEVDDQAAGVQSLWSRRYVDRLRVGIHGVSYGGTASALCLLRYPEVFQAASASAGVMDFRNYDTIYTERYMGLMPEDEPAYTAGSTLTYAGKLQGRLLLYYGTADNNVHPNNTMQLVQALQRAGKSFEVQVGPDEGHGGVNRDRMMEFFIENLVMRAPASEPAKKGDSKRANRS